MEKTSRIEDRDCTQSHQEDKFSWLAFSGGVAYNPGITGTDMTRILRPILAVILFVGTYMPYLHASSTAETVAPTHESCGGHGERQDRTHVSDCLSQTLLRQAPDRVDIELDTNLSPDRFVVALSPRPYPPYEIARSLRQGLSPPSSRPLSCAPARFIATTILLI